VREAERIMVERAAEALSITEIAAELEISARSLSEGFRRFRGISPHDFMTAQRLDGLRRALLQAERGETVRSIASARGYVNFGAMTAAYRNRFGETPGQTLAATRA
jgi:transcriptional regulator GlxA family with amidase domain